MMEVDFKDQSFRHTPHEEYSRLRRQSPIAKVKGINAYVATTHHDCKTLLKHPSIALAQTPPEVLPPTHPMQGYLQMRKGLMLFANAPRHTVLKEPAQPSFKSGLIKQYEPLITTLAEQSMDQLSTLLTQNETVDFVSQISIPFVSKVICKVVGMPDQDHLKLASLTQTVADGLDPLGPKHSLQKAGQAYLVFQSYMSQELAKGRWTDHAEEFSQSFLGEIAECPHMLGGFQTPEDLISTTIMLLSAGHLTTNHSLSSSLDSLLSTPSLQSRILTTEHPLSAVAMEEFFRYHTPAQITRRILTDDLTISNQQLVKGQALWLALVSANRDEKVFTTPQSLNLERRPNPHLAFGAGEHFCLGTHLARLQLRIFLNTMQGRFPNLQVVSKTPDSNLVFRGMKQLLLTIR